MMLSISTLETMHSLLRASGGRESRRLEVTGRPRSISEFCNVLGREALVDVTQLQYHRKRGQ